MHAPARIRLHAAELPAEHVTDILGLPVTTAARTAIDLARALPFRAGVVAADSALHRRLATKDELQSVLATCSRWRGAATAAGVIGFADGRSESPLESIARVVFRDCGLPPPQLQALIGTAQDVARVPPRRAAGSGSVTPARPGCHPLMSAPGGRRCDPAAIR
jgi:hypothetical protein